MNLIMNPSTRLLNTEGAPLVLRKQALLWHLLEDVLGKEYVAVLVDVVLVLLGVLDLLWEMWHLRSSFEY